MKTPARFVPEGKCTPHFGWRELCRSDFARRNALKNAPNAAQRVNLKRTATGLERVRAAVRGAVRVNSCLRTRRVNAGVGSSSRSFHIKGLAADIETRKMSNLALARLCVKSCPNADKVILEFYDPAEGKDSGWVHIQFAPAGTKPRRQWFIAYKDKAGKTRYRRMKADFTTPY